MALFDKMKDSISIAGQEVAQKTKNATENVRVGNQMKSNERMIEKLTYQVGLQCVKNHLQETDSEYGELFAEILRLQRENQNLQEELQRATAVNTCTQCGMGNKMTAKFCVACGAPLTAKEAVPAPGAKRCPNCGQGNDSDASFCVGCGTPLPEMEEPVVDAEPEAIPEEPVKPVCKNCGAQLEEDMLFCVQCGTKRD